MTNIRYLPIIIGIIFSLGCVDGGIRQREVLTDTGVESGGGVENGGTEFRPSNPGTVPSDSGDPIPSPQENTRLTIVSFSSYHTPGGQTISSDHYQVHISSSATSMGTETGSANMQMKDLLNEAIQKSLIQ